MQSTRARAGSRTMNMRFVRPLSKGSSQAPTMRRRPGCTHSTLIVVFLTHEPHLAQQLGHHDDQRAGDKTVECPPRRPVLEREVWFVLVEKHGSQRLTDKDRCQNRVEQARHPRETDGILQILLEKHHGFTIPASVTTGP